VESLGAFDRLPWNRVLEFVLRRPKGWRQLLMLRVIRGLRDPSNPYVVYPEIDRGTLSVYDMCIYDHTFRAKSLSVAATRWRTGYVLNYSYHKMLEEPVHQEWVVREEYDINQFIQNRFAELDWRRRAESPASDAAAPSACPLGSSRHPTAQPARPGGSAG
jgi:hypothetical protein